MLLAHQSIRLMAKPTLKKLWHDFLVFVLAAGTFLVGGLDGLDRAFMDLGFRFDRSHASDQVVVVEINESSLQELGVWPFPRRYHAQVVDRLVTAGASTIALDIDFSSPSHPEDDGALAAALTAAGGRVILPVFRQAELGPDGRQRILRSAPIPSFRDAVRLASFNVRPDADGVVRRMEYRGDDGEPLFAAMVANRLGADRDRYYVDFGIDVRTLTRFSYADVLNGRFDPAVVAGKLVLVGATAVQLGDMVAVPVYQALPGVTLQALAYQSLSNGSAFHELDLGYALGGALLLALAAGPLLRRCSWRLAMGSTAGTIVVLAIATVALQTAMALFLASSLWILTVVVSLAAALLTRINQQDLLLIAQGLAIQRRGVMMKTIVENSFDAIITVTDSGDIRTVNPAAEAMFGYAAEHLIGENVAKLIAPSQPERRSEKAERENLFALHRTLGKTGTRRLVAVDRQGNRKTLDLAISQMKFDQENLTIIIGRDVTKRVEIEQALVQAKETAELSSRSKTEFLHNMSHELRTPLNAIIGFSEAMQKEIFGPLSAHHRDYVGDIHASGCHLLAVINDILDVAKIESGRFDLTEEYVAVSDILEAAIRLIRDRAVRGGVTIVVPVAAHELPVVRADGRVLKQVLLNLLDNAAKFTESGGNVVVTAAVAASGAFEITVADDGIGIAAERLNSVMEPFGQADGSLSRKYGGTGLGLPLAKRFMEMHGGSLTLESALGVGTKVTIALPSERVMPLSSPEQRIAS